MFFNMLLYITISVGASQVKWNKVTNNCFATTHEGDVRIWDPRVSIMIKRHATCNPVFSFLAML